MGLVQTVSQAYLYAASHLQELVGALEQHLTLVGISLGVAMLLGIPLGIWSSRSAVASTTIINAINGIRVVPSLAVLFLIVPYFGLSSASAAIALTLLALPPVLINTDAGFRGVSPPVREAAFGMGMTPGQVFRRIDFPLALPVVIAGVRTAAVEVIGSATLAAFVGSGGLGIYITRGFALYDQSILLVGAVPVALLTLFAEAGLNGIQRLAQPPG